ncbi:7-deoxyloganetic acid glucosyl transferase-like [Mercurialis annua]|uniref:7-deoxyloganetic acid glucosyl transferase-like n=1 Tax=Mercurialis annua TaxID=3986 RepID=UPI00215EB7D0|nr:7-deoxyloganetic acid glucosyl transferase-like [Mercurialis annua]
MKSALNYPSSPPHVLIFPVPAQGHVNSMLKLAELLSISGIHVTFLNTDRSQELLTRFTDVQARFTNKYPGFKFLTITDGLDHDSPVLDPVMAMFDSMKLKSKPVFKKMLTDIRPEVDCVIGDGILGFIAETCFEVGVPVIHFRTVSACCFWACFNMPDMIEAGELPIRGEEDMDRLITKVPGMETFLRCRDLPSYCRKTDVNDPLIRMVIEATMQCRQVHALIFNTFEELEGDTLSQIRNHCPKIFSIGPLHELLNVKLNTQETQQYSLNSLSEIDRSCMTWLDGQETGSVIYVSFGSNTSITKEQVTEIWHGIANSKTRFLWVIRPGSVTDKNDGSKDDDSVDKISRELQEGGPKENGYVVKWAPQEEVLGHKAIGGFLTHNGWNSTLESIVAGVPMICWPNFVDQLVNSRFVSEIWKIGLDMKDVCDRKIVEKMVNDLMVNKRDEFVKSSSRMAELARKSVSEGGSSWSNLDRLIEEIRVISRQGDHHD